MGEGSRGDGGGEARRPGSPTLGQRLAGPGGGRSVGLLSGRPAALETDA